MSRILKTLMIGSILAASVACHRDDGTPAPDQGTAPPSATADGSQASGSSGEPSGKSSGTDAGQAAMQHQNATQNGMHPTDPQQPPPTDHQQH
ncbi:hypothetical protein [Xanthomonas sp. MUS 060]|uniref:hypothetical protein n=1 Tax=Xanthomonas sp. MUS 060 TaxID=1588031 RepID=UPI000AD0B1DE|nr:hypothetical protein [Xanthomonas sp. MUS 060]